nr:MAG TPA: hypothetical protein [Caudoviricetes sp.]
MVFKREPTQHWVPQPAPAFGMPPEYADAWQRRGQTTMAAAHLSAAPAPLHSYIYGALLSYFDM